MLTQKNPEYPFQFQAVGLIIYVLRNPDAMPETLYSSQASPKVLPPRRVEDTSATTQ